MGVVAFGHLERHLTQSVPAGTGQEGVDQLERCSAGIGYSRQDPKMDVVANKKLLFQPGVLEALSGAVAARLASPGEGNANANLCFRFNANMNATQILHGKKGKKDRKYREVNKGGEAHAKVLGNKRKLFTHVQPTGSEVEFSFEKSLDGYERMLYGDISVSCKRVCMGRVEVVKDGEGVVSHVAKEMEEEDEEVLWLPQLE
ncbi:hypothetical protein D1007_24052 [Hordeum vulgare]|nr:hypothetical protein D1007_24052 [Hordeum vulgare]